MTDSLDVSGFKEFQMGGQTYRVVRRGEEVRERGYVDPVHEEYTVLQRKDCGRLLAFLGVSRWIDVEKEYVPSSVWISEGTLGFDDSGWHSELITRCQRAVANSLPFEMAQSC